MEQITEKTIDIDRLLLSKMGTKAKFVPRPLVSWLKHIIHQDRVNAYLWESRHLSGTDWLEECVRYLDMTLDVVGMENLPAKDDGRLYTFVSNHPLGGADGVALGAIIGRHYDGRFRYLVNDLLIESARPGTGVHPHQQDRRPKPRFSGDGGERIPQRQPYADVSCRHLFTPTWRRDTRCGMEEDVRHQECRVQA